MLQTKQRFMLKREIFWNLYINFAMKLNMFMYKRLKKILSYKNGNLI